MKTREHFLADLVNERGFTQMAELGLWKGRTFLHCLATCPACTFIGVDAWAYAPDRAKVEGGETYAEWNMAELEKTVRREAAKYGDRAIIIKADTAEAAKQVVDGALDIIFIDADHSEEGVRRDIQNWGRKVRKGGIIAGHDIDWPTVKKVVEEFFGSYNVAVDNVWWVEC